MESIYFGLWWISLAEYLLVLRVLFPILQMALCIMVIARVASIPLWMRSKPWAGFFFNPSTCFCGLWSYFSTVLNYVGNFTFELNCFRFIYQTRFVITGFILWWWKCICELYVICDMYVESYTILVVVNRLSRSVVVLNGLPGLYGFKYDSASACGLPLYLYSYKLVGSATAGIRARFNVNCHMYI